MSDAHVIESPEFTSRPEAITWAVAHCAPKRWHTTTTVNLDGAKTYIIRGEKKRTRARRKAAPAHA